MINVQNKGKIIYSRLLLLCYLSASLNPLIQEIFHSASHVLSDGTFHFHNHSNKASVDHHHGISTDLITQNPSHPAQDQHFLPASANQVLVHYYKAHKLSFLEGKEFQVVQHIKNLILPKSIYTNIAVPPPKEVL